jgi:hydrogenase maturation protease
MKILVLGIGQSLRGDDGAGLEAVRLWQATYPKTAQQVNVLLSELPGLGMLDLLDGTEAAILVDAVHGSAAAGTLHRIAPEKLESFTTGSASAHGWGVAETLHLGRMLYPELDSYRITLIGIEAGTFELGAGLSPQVQAALPEAARLIEREIQDVLLLS